MEQAHWLKVRALLESALEHPVAERKQYLSVVCGGDDSLCAEVLSLISAHDRASYLEDIGLPAHNYWLGRRLGPWLLGRCIGQGGMGAVYEAIRDDHEYEQRVAVKLVNAVATMGESVRRFHNERQLLAHLRHPFIAQMLDGGTTEEGIPYLVMEYVEGESIDRFCANRQLSVRELLTLFRSVCSAVEYAHRNLVVHRDIKPGNILVTAEGSPKLLDFGIAKLLSADPGGELTRTTQRPMTPAYASPEQISGNPVTTASDVYSLGALLYRLLTGALPHANRILGPDLERAILQEDAILPSNVPGLDGSPRKLLEGDLDAIVCTAMRKESALRYPSVESFSEDVGRHLQGLPIRARQTTALYRATRFVKRHRAGVAVAMAVAMGLLIATATSIRFAHQARTERQFAEVRFKELRSLAHFFLFEFDDAIRAGSTAARHSVVEKGLAYLNRLAQTKSDSDIAYEIIAGYCRVGDLQGNLFYPNLGDPAGAKASYQKAAVLLHALVQTGSNRRQNDKMAALVEQKLGEIAVTAGSRPEALDHFHRAQALLQPEAGLDRAVQRSLAQIHSRAGFTHYQNGHWAAALDEYEQTLHIASALTSAGQADLEVQKLVATGNQRTGELLAKTGSVNDGLQRIRLALGEFESLTRENADDHSLLRNISSTHILLGSILSENRRRPEALEEFRQANDQTEKLVSYDPKNIQYRRDRTVAMSLLAALLYEMRQKEEAHRMTVQTLNIMKAAADSEKASEYDLHEYCRVLTGTPFLDLRNPEEARRYAERVILMTQGGNPRIFHLLAKAFDQAGKVRQAVETEEKALSMLPVSESGRRVEMEASLASFRAHMKRAHQ